MSERLHAIVWIDHREARIMHFDSTREARVIINSHSSVQRLHHQGNHQGNQQGSKHKAVDAEFFGRIVAALNHMGSTVIAGPGNPKFELENYMHQQRPDLAASVYFAEIPDHPGDAGLITLAREYFKSLHTREPQTVRA